MPGRAPEGPGRAGALARAVAAALLVGLLAAGAWTVGVRQIGSWDFWWHLAIGREVVEQRTTLPEEVFCFAHRGAPLRCKDLVVDSAMYLGYRVLGFPWISAMKALAFLLGCLGLWLALAPGRRRPLLLVLAVALHAIAVQNRLVERPLMFSLALFPLLLGGLEVAGRRLRRAESTRERARLWALPVLLMWAWANLHRGSLVGLALLAGFALWLGALALARRRPALAFLGPETRARDAAWASGAAAAAAVAGLATPCGAALYAESFDVPSDPTYRATISEWQAPSLGQVLETAPETLALALGGALASVAVLAGLALRRRRGEALHGFHLAVVLLFAALSATAARWLVYAAMAGAFALVKAAEEAVGRSPRLAALAGSRPLSLAAAAALLALVHVVNSHPPGSGPEQDRFPEAALRFARDHGLAERVANDLALGGYLVWAGYPRFSPLIDGRTAMVHPRPFLARVVRAHHDPEVFDEVRREHDLDWVLAQNLPGHESFAFLSRDPAWMLVHWDTPAAIYVLRERYPGLAGQEYRFLDRVDPVGGLGRAVEARRGRPEALARVEAELLRALGAAPRDLRAHALLALFYDAIGPGAADRRDRHLEALRRLAPDHPATVELHRRLLGRPR